MPIASASAPVVPWKTIWSVASPRLIAISISARPLVSRPTPGARAPPVWSTVSDSSEPAAPLTVIESVFVVVAAPQAVGVEPKWIAPPTTASVADPLAGIAAVTDFVAALYVHDPPGGGGGGGGPASMILFSTAIVAGSRLASTVAVSMPAAPWICTSVSLSFAKIVSSP